MAGSKPNSFESTIIDHILGAASWTPPATVYVALFTTTPTETTSGTEVSGNNYSRVAVTNNSTNWPNATNGLKKNGTAIAFPTPSGSWGTVAGMAIFDAASGGNMMFYSTLASSRAVAAGEPVYFAANAISIQEA